MEAPANIPIPSEYDVKINSSLKIPTTGHYRTFERPGTILPILLFQRLRHFGCLYTIGSSITGFCSS